MMEESNVVDFQFLESNYNDGSNYNDFSEICQNGPCHDPKKELYEDLKQS